MLGTSAHPSVRNLVNQYIKNVLVLLVMQGEALSMLYYCPHEHKEIWFVSSIKVNKCSFLNANKTELIKFRLGSICVSKKALC